MSESEGYWGLIFQTVDGNADVSGLVFRNWALAEQHAETLRHTANIVSVEVRRLSLVKG